MKDEYSFRIRRVVQWTIFVLAGTILGWGFTSPQYQPWFAGLGLGTTIGLISAVFTAWKVHKVGEVAIQHQGKKKQVSLGMPTRLALAVLATVITLQYSEIFHIATMVIGLMIPSIIALVDSLLYNLLHSQTDEGGE